MPFDHTDDEPRFVPLPGMSFDGPFPSFHVTGATGAAGEMPVHGAPELKSETMQRFNQGKSQLHLVPSSLMEYAAAVLAYGALKYSANNWRKGGNWTQIQDSLQRHLNAFHSGEDFDPESGLPHLSHAVFNLMALIEFFDKGLGTDDRFRYPGQPHGSRLPGRVLEFREPPRRE